MSHPGNSPPLSGLRFAKGAMTSGACLAGTPVEGPLGTGSPEEVPGGAPQASSPHSPQRLGQQEVKEPSSGLPSTRGLGQAGGTVSIRQGRGGAGGLLTCQPWP